jgi:hypothetical protein
MLSAVNCPATKALRVKIAQWSFHSLSYGLTPIRYQFVVIKHEADLVQVAVKLEVYDFNPMAGLAIVEIIDELSGITEEHEIEAIFVPNAGNIAYQVGIVLPLCAAHIAWLVNKPCDARGRAMLFAELFDADASRPNEISPPSIVRSSLKFLPFAGETTRR